jgi:D-beta-D-heptose 7-phosphate kinase/D-beta-D-heptose 1-phosphate adenosyltransferase
MTYVSRDGMPMHYATKALKVFDVTGAGDTVVAALSLTLACRKAMAEAIELASHAAAIAVSRPGTVAVVASDLMAAVGGV